MSDSSYPMDCSLPGSSVHGIFQANHTGSLLFPIKWGNRVRSRAVSLHINREIIASAVNRAPKSLINFPTNKCMNLLKEWINEWSLQILRNLLFMTLRQKKKLETIRLERMAIYFLFSQARCCRKYGNWLQLMLFKEILTFQILRSLS